MVNGAVGKASTAFNAAKPYLGAAAGVFGVIDTGMEAKNRIDRGEDAQRVATGTAVKGLANAAGLGLMATANPLGIAAGLVLPTVAGFVTDRVTDAVRGNDGKGTDAVVRDLNEQARAAESRGDYSRAGQLIQESIKFQNSRMPAGSQGANSYQAAQQNDVQQSDATEFGNLQSGYRMAKAINEDAFTTTLNNGQRQFEQQFNQQSRMLDDNQRRGQIERLRNQARDIQNKATATQQDMILNGANAINDYGRTFAQGLSQSYQGGGIR
jgi:hypothetical protein